MSQDRIGGGSRSRRGVWSHWVPLAATVTIATAGVAAWVWSQRRSVDEDDVSSGLDYEYLSGDDRSRSPPRLPPAGEDQTAGPSQGWRATVTSVLNKAPGPQQFIDKVATAAGSAVGKVLTSIGDEEKPESTLRSEEGDADRERAPVVNIRRKTVAIVVSAGSQYIAEDHVHASILSHIPHVDPAKVKLVVLIHAPGLNQSALDNFHDNQQPPSLSSSYSNIAQGVQEHHGEGLSSTFKAVYNQALALVNNKQSMVIPFTTPNGHAPILRHINPEVIYLQESLSGDNGSIITNLQTWLRHDVVVVVGAEGGSGGLADSESDAEKSGEDNGEKWWKKTERVGRGRGAVVVDAMRVHDDWTHRVQRHQ